VWEFYGSTEGQFTACAASEWLDHEGSVGRARPHRTLEADEGGMIWCTVPRYARYEYWRDPDKTARSWRPPAPGRDGAFGAFTVGDLGRLDADGYLYLEGRRSDLIITGGINVYPAEIEAVIGRHDGVADVAVFAVDDEQWGQRVCAAVVGDVAPDELDRYARAHLAGYKRPKEFFVVAELPHTTTGKLQRNRVAAVLGIGPPPQGSGPGVSA
jgi:long-chain acyl-CoA synthetase